jgi:predicted nucleic acid-binding protein
MPASAKKKKIAANFPAAFWDASAIVLLCCLQPQTQAARQARRLFPQLVTWWATSVECNSALRRLERFQELTARETQQAFQELDRLRLRWTEVAPLEEVRSLAERLLGSYPLRAADSLQLAAALTWCNRHPRGKTFVSGDEKLLEAAEKEGFNIVRM